MRREMSDSKPPTKGATTIACTLDLATRGGPHSRKVNSRTKAGARLQGLARRDRRCHTRQARPARSLTPLDLVLLVKSYSVFPEQWAAGQSLTCTTRGLRVLKVNHNIKTIYRQIISRSGCQLARL